MPSFSRPTPAASPGHAQQLLPESGRDFLKQTANEGWHLWLAFSFPSFMVL